MNVTFTRHARQRMAQRRVTEEQVVETLETPDEVVPGDHEEETVVRRYGAREVRAVYLTVGAESYVILTVMKPKTHAR